MSEQTTSAENPGDGLERLLEVEARIDERLATCRAEADGILRAVQAELAAREEQFERELDVEREQRVASRSAERAADIQDERDRAARQAKRLRAVPPERIEALARELIERLLADGSEPAR